MKTWQKDLLVCVVAVTVFILLALLSACTDATMAHMAQYNDPSDVVCYSGAEVIYQGASTGKIQSNEGEDGLYFKEAGTGKFVRLYADCIVKSR